MKNIRVFLFENFQFLEVKFSINLNRDVFVMRRLIWAFVLRICPKTHFNIARPIKHASGDNVLKASADQF